MLTPRDREDQYDHFRATVRHCAALQGETYQSKCGQMRRSTKASTALKARSQVGPSSDGSGGSGGRTGTRGTKMAHDE